MQQKSNGANHPNVMLLNFKVELDGNIFSNSGKDEYNGEIMLDNDTLELPCFNRIYENWNGMS